jgi:hypothetical protein
MSRQIARMKGIPSDAFHSLEWREFFHLLKIRSTPRVPHEAALKVPTNYERSGIGALKFRRQSRNNLWFRAHLQFANSLKYQRGKVAERFKAPVLKFVLSCAGP